MNRRRKLEHKKSNLTCTFILPMCGVNHKNLPTNFINAYIDENYNVYMVFDKTEDYDIVFHHYFEHLKKKNEYIEEIQDKEDEIVIKFNIPGMYLEQYNLFIKGKYSKFDEEYKDVLKRYFGVKSIPDSYIVSTYNTIYPQDFKFRYIAERLYEKKDVAMGMKILKEVGEVLDPPNMEKELYKSIEQLTETKESEQI